MYVDIASGFHVASWSDGAGYTKSASPVCSIAVREPASGTSRMVTESTLGTSPSTLRS